MRAINKIHTKYENKQNCGRCVIPASYDFAETNSKGECKFCQSFSDRTFAGSDALIRDLDLKEGEKVGVTVSGGKDSIYMWGVLTELLGAEHLVALSYYRPGITSEVAMDNVRKAKQVLNTELVVVEDKTAYPRFRQNLGILLEKPDPAAVRVLLCAGCRYGITGTLYAEGAKRGVTKYISGASYLELAPFKEELLQDKSPVKDIDEGFNMLLKDYPELDYDNNLDVICRDHKYKYKDNNSMKSRIPVASGQKLFDFDAYFENRPEDIERIVKEKYGWNKTNRSWHFDCIVEDIKDVFYYGLLGYTETDFKLSAMVRHGLLTRGEALEKIQQTNYELAHSYEKMLETLQKHNLEDKKTYLDKLYKESPYLVMEGEDENEKWNTLSA